VLKQACNIFLLLDVAWDILSDGITCLAKNVREVDAAANGDGRPAEDEDINKPADEALGVGADQGLASGAGKKDRDSSEEVDGSGRLPVELVKTQVGLDTVKRSDSSSNQKPNADQLPPSEQTLPEWLDWHTGKVEWFDRGDNAKSTNLSD